MEANSQLMADLPEPKRIVRSQIAYERLAREDVPALSRLANQMRTETERTLRVRSYAPAYYDWMYFQNPAGPAIAVAGWHENHIVTSFAIAPKRIQIDGETLVCGKTMDMFTHPDYQGLGLMTEAASRAFDGARAQGIHMWYVMPSRRSYPIFTKKWRYLETHRVHYLAHVLDYAAVLETLIRPTVFARIGGTVLNLSRRLFKRLAPLDDHFEFRNERRFGAETDELWQRCRNYRIALVRDAGYLTWRYLDNPDQFEIVKTYARDTLRGILVTKLTKRRGLKVGEFVDCVAAPEDVDARRAMYRHGLSRFMTAGCAFAQNWAIENSQQERELQDLGFTYRRRKVPVLLSPNAPRQEFYDARAWLLTPGDGNDL